jgi:hypothetical protein
MGVSLPRFSLILCGLFLSAAAPGQVVISPAGSDDGAGTWASPFATPHRAQVEARKMRKLHPERGVVVLVQRGTYHLNHPLVFGPEDGGGENAEVIWTATQGGGAVFSGGVEVSNWEQTEDGHLRAKLPPELQGERVGDLYFKHRRLTPARFPNADWLRVDKAGEDRRTSFTFDSSAVDIEIPDSNGLQIYFLHDWATSRIPVAEFNQADGFLRTRTPIGCELPFFAIDNFEPHPRFYLEGHQALMDESGEWVQDPVSGDLLVVPPFDIPKMRHNPATAETMIAVAPLLEHLIEVRGTETEPVRNLHFVGIGFQHSRYLAPADGWAAIQASMHDLRDGSGKANNRAFVPAAVELEFAKDCSISHGRFHHLGGSGLWLKRGCVDVQVKDCMFANINANGINIGEDASRLVDGKPWWMSSDLSDPTLARNVSVQWCDISRVGMRYGGSVGVWIGFAADCRVGHNRIHSTPYTGISVGWEWSRKAAPSGGHLIHNNHIMHVMQLLSDGGCIYTLGRQPGTVIRGNALHNVPRHAGRAPSNGIFVDEGSSEMVIEKNLIYDIGHTPIRFHRAGPNKVIGNVLITKMDSPYFYNSTDPKEMEYVDNVVREKKEHTDQGFGQGQRDPF